MRLSIIIPVLDSHEIVRRQLLHFERIGLPENTELILVDDGSDPPLEKAAIPDGMSLVYEDDENFSGPDKVWVCSEKDEGLGFTIVPTHDKRPWTWALARNFGARLAEGEYLLFFDIDHIVTRELLDFVHKGFEHKVQFLREIAVLDENGVLTQDRDVLAQYGFGTGWKGTSSEFDNKDLKIGPLPNNFAMRRDLFWELGGYREDLVERPYPQGEDRLWKKTWYDYQRRTGNFADPFRPTIYVFPVGKIVGDVDYNPQGLFHNLSRKTNRNHWYQEQKRKETNETR